MKKILSVISGNIEAGGLETYLKNAYENMNRSDLTIDILVPGKIVFESYADDFRNMGCKLLVMNIPQNNGLRYLKLYCALNKILKESEYDLIHINTGNLMIQAVALKVAFLKGVPIRVSHSHGTLYKDVWIKELCRSYMRVIVNRYATKKLSCTKLAAESLFGASGAKDAIIAKNGIRVDNYKFDEDIRERIRLENGWNNKFVIGSVGRLAPEKNYKFLLNVFADMLIQNSECSLVLIGDGIERKSLEEESIRLGIKDKVQFLGVRSDVAQLMQGLDVFVLASKREALGIVNIEAQAAGLPCVVSDALPREVDITGNVTFIHLDNSTEEWVRAISTCRAFNRKDNTNIIKANGYDFEEAYSVIDKIYHGQL